MSQHNKILFDQHKKKEKKLNTYKVWACVQSTTNFVGDMCRPLSIGEHSRSIKSVENSDGIYDSSNNIWLDLPCYSTWPASRMREKGAESCLMTLYAADRHTQKQSKNNIQTNGKMIEKKETVKNNDDK